MFRTATSQPQRPTRCVSFDDFPDDLDPDPAPVVPANLVLGLMQRRSPGEAVGPGRVAGGSVGWIDRGLPGRQPGRGGPRRIADDFIPQARADDLARLQVHHGREHIR